MHKKTLQHQLKDLFADVVSAMAAPQKEAVRRAETEPKSARSDVSSARTADQATKAGPSVRIRGQKDGLLVILDDEQDWSIQMAELETTLESNRTFFAGARLAIQAGKRLLSMSDVQNLQARLAQRSITLWAVISDSKATQAAIRYLNLATELEAPQPSPEMPAEAQQPSPVAEEHGWLIHRTLRSGQKVHHPGHVTIIGDVNPGAEIIAGGHIVVWGRLQGLVHAGAMGDDNSVVCALDLSPTQLRIGNHIARSPEEKRRRRTRPEMASVSEGRIVAESWDSKQRHKK